MAAGEFAQGMDRFLGANHAALFQHMAKDHDDRQQRGGEQITGGPGAEHGQGDQLVGDAVQARKAQAVPGRTHHRHRHQQGCHAKQQLADAALVGREPAPHQAQHEQAQGEHRQGQLPGSAALLG